MVRLISNGVVSIEWLEPSMKNGISFEYQLIRTLIIKQMTEVDHHEFEDKSETIYIGKNLC